MVKRSADVQITKDNPTLEMQNGAEDPRGGSNLATPEQMRKRSIKTPRSRMRQAGGGGFTAGATGGSFGAPAGGAGGFNPFAGIPTTPFGPSASTSPAPQAPSANPFGAPAQQASSFGSNASTTSNAFGGFGQQQQQSSNVFGAQPSTPKPENSMFGGGSQPSNNMFGAPQPAQQNNMFGGNAPSTSFGNPPTQQSSGGIFGSNNAQKPISTPSFNPPSSTSFQFGATNNAPNSNNQSSSFQFGANNNAAPASGNVEFTFGANQGGSFNSNNGGSKPGSPAPGAMFGNKPPGSPAPGAMFGNPPGSPAPGAMFGNNPPASPGPGAMFGNNPPGSPGPGAMFNIPKPASPAPTNFFGAPKPASPAPSNMFGNNPTSAPSFGQQPAASTNNIFGNNNAGQSSSSNMFGNQANNNASSNLFGNNNNASSNLFGNQPKPASPAPSNLFGGNATPAAAQPPAKSPAPFLFGSGSTPAASTPAAQPSSGIFGNKPAEAPKPASKPLFGSQPASTPLFGKPAEESKPPGAGLFGSSAQPPASMPLFGSTPAAPASTPLFGAKPEEKPAATPLFGAKPEEKKPPSTPLFGAKPADAPATSNLFGKPAETSSTPVSFGGAGVSTPSKETKNPFEFLNTPKQAPAAEPPKFNMFGQAEKKEEPLATTAGSGGLFGSVGAAPEAPKNLFGDSKPASTPLFGSTENKDKPAGGLFGSKAAEKPSTSAGNIFGAPSKDAEPKSTPFSFGKPAAAPEPEKKEAPKPPLFGVPAEPKPSAAAQARKAAVEPLGTPAKPPPSASGMLTRPSSKSLSGGDDAKPPSDLSPAEQKDWEYLYKVKSLNHAFLKSLESADMLVEWKTHCNLYLETLERVKKEVFQLHAKRSFDESDEPSTFKRSKPSRSDNTSGFMDGVESTKKAEKKEDKTMDDEKKPTSETSTLFSDLLNKKADSAPASKSSGEPGKLADKPLFAFKPPTASTSLTNTGGVKLAAKPAFGFTPPSSTPASASSSFETKKLADKPSFEFKPPSGESKETGSFKLATKPAFGFTPPAPSTSTNGDTKKDETPKSNGTSDSPLDKTYKPGTPIKFGASSTTTSSAPSIFSNIPALAPPSSTATSTAPSSSASTPAPANDEDAAPPEKQVELGGKGAGEENEDVLVEHKGVLYSVSAGKVAKVGVGRLRVLQDQETKKCRVLMRDELGRIFANFLIQKDLNYMLKEGDPKAVIMPEVRPPPEGQRMLIAKFKTPAAASEVVDVIVQNK